MQESIGSISLFLIVITLIVLFTGIITLTVNRSNSFAIKDEIISIIEADGGFDMNATYNYDTDTGDSTLRKIVEAISSHEYRQTGTCPTPEGNYQEVSCYDRVGNRVYTGDQATIIIIKKRGSQTEKKAGTTEPYYFETKVFYRIDLPILNDVLVFHVDGQTKAIYTGATN